MARNYIQPGDTITMVAPVALASGSGMLVGAVFAVALANAAQGAPIEARRVGVFDMAKATGQAWVADTTKLYWDNAARNVTSTAAGNTLIGVARQSQAAGDAIGRVLLTGQITA